MSFSFARIGFWRLIAVGLALEIAHFAIKNRWPEISPHYHGVRSPWAKALLLSEYFVLLAALIAAVGIIEDKLEARDFSSILFIICVWIANFGLVALFLN